MTLITNTGPISGSGQIMYMIVIAVEVIDENSGKYARMAELVDALASGASARKSVGVQVPLRAHMKNTLRS